MCSECQRPAWRCFLNKSDPIILPLSNVDGSCLRHGSHFIHVSIHFAGVGEEGAFSVDVSWRTWGTWGKGANGQTLPWKRVAATTLLTPGRSACLWAKLSSPVHVLGIKRGSAARISLQESERVVTSEQASGSLTFAAGADLVPSRFHPAYSLLQKW